ncbi:MAG: hypothetical protein QOH50_3568 [Kribbellaceae bacterium]|jgi:hypothetical protein|nr:hypothetical protein [Kribbellaceae bacterium]
MHPCKRSHVQVVRAYEKVPGSGDGGEEEGRKAEAPGRAEA